MWTKVVGFVALFVAAISSGGCAGATFDATSPAGAARATNQFGFDLYAELKQDERNLIYSPAGAAIALAMTSGGARGRTLEEMTKVLHIDPVKLAESHASFGSLLETLNARDGKQGLALHVADQLWGRDDVDFESDFVSLLGTHYRAPLELLDFAGAPDAARKTINGWAAEKTRGRIRQILPEGGVHADTVLVLTNAIYFKGAWLSQFSPDSTTERPFSTAAGKVNRKLMAQRALFRHATVGNAALVELPYKGGLSMIVILPDESSTLDAVESRLAGDYDGLLGALNVKDVDLWLPRWTATSELSLGKTLEKMGMTTAFDRRADFTGMAQRKPNDPPIYIERVLQQAFIDVDEVGTEAAAVTAVAAVEESAEPDEPERVVFHADRPFLFVIRDTKTGVVLFAGRVVDP